MKRINLIILMQLISIVGLQAAEGIMHDESTSSKVHSGDVHKELLPVPHDLALGVANHHLEENKTVLPKSKFDIKKVISQSHELVKQKEKIKGTLEACFDLISQAETFKRRSLHDSSSSMSDQEIEDKVQEFLMQELGLLYSDFIKINKDFAEKIFDLIGNYPIKGFDLLLS
ncbi:hypothetical protein HYV11_02990 [Candidatus Dependentiae bacterium]|nr:hypothetical protein [Candidatus Dependentiae bacterium]